MEIFGGDTRIFLVINTTDYNNDGIWAVGKSAFDELKNLGFDEDAVKRIGEIGIGGVLTDFDEKGVIVVRVA